MRIQCQVLHFDPDIGFLSNKWDPMSGNQWVEIVVVSHGFPFPTKKAKNMLRTEDHTEDMERALRWREASLTNLFLVHLSNLGIGNLAI